MPSTRGKPTGSRRQQRKSATAAYNQAAYQYTNRAQGRRAQVRSAGIKGAVVGGAAGTFVAPGLGTAVGAVVGAHIAGKSNSSKQYAQTAAGKKAMAALKKGGHSGKGKNTQKTMTKSHAGKAGGSPSKTASKPGGPKGKKTNYKRGEHGRFAGSQ